MKQRSFDEGTLRKLYVEQGMSIKELSKVLKTSSHTLGRELKKLGISKTRAQARTTHGMHKTRMYRIWQHMKVRCDNPKAIHYANYGGKGISYCDKWRTFEGFLEDMKNGYSDNLTLDRIDNQNGYCKNNCRWVGYVEQNNNKSDNVNIKRPVKELMKITGLSQHAIYDRIKKGWSEEKIISTPKLSFNGQEKQSKEGG